MDWIIEGDRSEAVISPEKHIKSSHGLIVEQRIRETAIIFELGYAMKLIREQFQLTEIIEKLPCFLHREPCYHIQGLDGVSFIQGGYGAPAAVDVLETILELGAKRIIVVGFCGGFSDTVKIGDLVMPREVRREEGTSYHYLGKDQICRPDRELYQRCYDHFSKTFPNTVHSARTVSTDAVYRQTREKERAWLSDDIIAVDMETSALLSVCMFYGIPAVSILMVSDVHTLDDKEDWDWGIEESRGIREQFMDLLMDFLKGQDYSAKNN